ncbi:hypothetical protein BCR44DRAFT_1501652 [Catenaria anguillulae PL171]|uniref:Ankyrin repeat-containing domain protein n=1 Tax=Catenaria anguillulae PL171 TaxID=765915 RepID=A0A1Y2HEL4_9FUNG|nr:hypothetical protein BCR44DRAFT_1501652 [Catenaria anguillulae PL171]
MHFKHLCAPIDIPNGLLLDPSAAKDQHAHPRRPTFTATAMVSRSRSKNRSSSPPSASPPSATTANPNVPSPSSWHSAPSACRAISADLIKAALCEVLWIYTGDWRERGVLAHAARNGHVQVLEWWFNQADAPEFILDELATGHMEAASRGGHLHIPAWIEATLGLSLGHPRMQLKRTFRSTDRAMDVRDMVNSALTHGDFHVLDWIVDDHQVDLHALITTGDGSASFEHMDFGDPCGPSLSLIGLVDMVTAHLQAAMDWEASKQLPLGSHFVSMVSTACKHNNLAALEWLVREYADEFREISAEGAFSEHACGNGHLDGCGAVDDCQPGVFA